MFTYLQRQIAIRLRAQRVAYFRNLRSQLGVYDYQAWAEAEKERR
ncbi:hypothetical protein [Prescottella agglutinans]|uniref:Uncharacterized protein n=1 Tax=Prescottella agglutinans TaxID=1644129 RepID=A0ABT6MF13_9NOCA|nr:hypothetical protein [Prescottella agglutinans]MDH6282862.1 hypothetical protein [Prescottella agglutinans]